MADTLGKDVGQDRHFAAASAKLVMPRVTEVERAQALCRSKGASKLCHWRVHQLSGERSPHLVWAASWFLVHPQLGQSQHMQSTL